jgi:hypothetical protein
MYIELIKEMSTPDHKLHNFLRKEFFTQGSPRG